MEIEPVAVNGGVAVAAVIVYKAAEAAGPYVYKWVTGRQIKREKRRAEELERQRETERRLTECEQERAVMKEQAKHQEEHQRKLEARIKKLEDYAMPAAVVADSEGKIVKWSEGAVVMLGYTADEAIGMSVSELVPLQDRLNHEKAYGSAREHRKLSKERIEFRWAHAMSKNGEKIPVRIELALISEDPLLFGADIVRRMM